MAIEREKILIVDDAEIDRLTLHRILQDTYDVVETDNAAEALHILNMQTLQDMFAAVVLDLVMPQIDGFEFLKQYRFMEAYRRVPVIVATTEDSADVERECLKLGAWDFIAKPYDPYILKFRLNNVIERSQQHSNKELRYRADYDVLTGIYNKDKFYEVTRYLLKMYPEREYAFVRIDIDKFQLVNAFYGMDEGDRLLRYLAKELQKFAGGTFNITYGRIKADVFGVCMPYQNEGQIGEFSAYMRARLRQYDLEFDLMPSIGIYRIRDREISIAEMSDRANLAVKLCKGNYITNYAFYSKEMSENIMREQRITNRMRSALDNEEFVLYIQPKFDLRSNRISGGEVLVRWNSEGTGLVSPGLFIPVFERNGFIQKLDYYVWEKTCAMLRRWMDEGCNPEPVSVNISRVSLYNSKLVEVICGLVEKYDIPRRLLQLELTESAYTDNPMAIREMMEHFRSEGFTILMDDFGSGYSSLNVLKDIVVDILKIDMKFLADTQNRGRSENILAAVVRMAKWLGMPVVAEGVEYYEQTEFLRSIGCEYVQGYYFAKPMPVAEYEELAFSDNGKKASDDDNKLHNLDKLWNDDSQMDLLFSNMILPVAIYEFTNDHVETIRVNDAYYDLFGYGDINYVDRGGKKTSLGKGNQKILYDAFKNTVVTKSVTETEFVRVRQNGGRLWIHIKLKYLSQVGENHLILGTLEDVTAQKKMELELQEYWELFSRDESKKKTVLIVDDVEANRMSLRCIFEDKYNVLEAANGKEALDVLLEGGQKADIILLDLMMPVMDGTTFVKNKSMYPEISDIPVVIITADDTEKKQAQMMVLGADDYVAKPFVPEIVSKRVENVLEARQQIEKKTYAAMRRGVE